MCQFIVSLLLLAVIEDAGASLEVFPSSVNLDGERDHQTLIVQWRSADGVAQDVTQLAEVRIKDEVCSLEKGVIRPVREGQTELTVSYNGLQRTVLVRVWQLQETPISFRREVMPILTKAGCNSGRCHGAARGKDGFHLSLFGYDPEGDYQRITQELFGRRINMARPQESLLLTKATGSVVHTGGKLMGEGDDSYNTLLAWLKQGALDDPDALLPTGIEVFPDEVTMGSQGETQKLSVRAHYADGIDRDVTDLAVFISSNDNSAAVSSEGIVSGGARGESFVMARFSTFTEGVPCIVGQREQQVPALTENANNYIDELVHAKLKRLNLVPSALCSDEEFLRRLHVDLLGVLPDRAIYERFVDDTRPDKRARLVREFLERPEFIDVWAMRFGELLGIRTANQVSYKALLSFHNWLRDGIEQGVPINQLIRDVLAASGGTFANPATNYYQIEANTLRLSEKVAQSFLGMRIQCAQCHNHPFDRWTMDDYYGFAAFFSQIGFKQSHDPREFIVYNSGNGETRHLVTNKVVAPKFLGGETPKLSEAQDRRAVLAEWVTSPSNAFFSKNIANIVWSHHFGIGIVEPVDDVRISNPPTNPALLEELSNRFVESDYDLRELVYDICTSKTYQRSTESNQWNAHDRKNFAYARVRRIRAEVMLDSITQLTNTTQRYPRLPLGARAVEIPDGAASNYFLSTFGRATRETVCACEVNVAPSLSQAFHLLNGESTNQRIREGKVVGSLLEAGQSPEQVIEHLYVLCFCRKPSQSEVDQLMAAIQRMRSDAGEDLSLEERLNDVFWALLNSKEFIFNH